MGGRLSISSISFCAILFGLHTVPICGKKNQRSILAHDARALLIQYEQAKQLYKGKQYDQSKLAFDALIRTNISSALSPYAHFYYALSAYHDGEQKLAAQTFDGMLTKFPSWNKKNEVYYWAAQCAFQEKDFTKALSLLFLIQDQLMDKSVAQMKKYFIEQIENCADLQDLLEKFPHDHILQEILYKKAIRQSYISQDFTLVNQLKKIYNFDDYPYDPLSDLQSKRKDLYRVAILFPFFVEELDYEACTSQFVIDLYQGIHLAIEALAKEGIAIQLFAFDTKNDAEVTKNLLLQEHLQYVDLIVGPLYPTTIPLVAAFAKKNKINFVNPISSNATIVDDNPFAFLFQSSLETHAQKAAALTLEDIHRHSISRPCIAVLYGSAREDVLQATRYKEIVERALGKKLDLFIQFTDSNMIKDFFLKAYHLEKNDSGEYALDNEFFPEGSIPLAIHQITHLYIPSHQELLVSSAVNLPFKLDIRPQIIGHEQWIKKEILTIDQLYRLPILFIAPHYIDFSCPNLLAFRKKIWQAAAAYPTEHSYTGYEMMLFFGRMLATYGIYFQKEWADLNYNGMLFQTIHYGKYHSNQCIPVLRFKQNKFELIAN